MNKIFSTLGLAAALLVAAPVLAADGGKTKKTVAPQAAEKLTVDAAASKVAWFATKVTGKHNGTVAVQSGTVDMTGGRLTGGSFVIDMTSIKVVDIQDPEYNGKLLGHLNSDDFFSVEKNPTSTFKITSVTAIKGAKAGQPNTTIGGDLTIKGITKPLTFPATVTVSNGQLTASGNMSVDRTKYDVRYGSKSFFNDIGDKAISDEMVFNVNVVAKK